MNEENEMPTTLCRSQDEIVGRARLIKNDTLFSLEVLVSYLDFEHAKEFLKPDTQPDQWKPDPADELDKEASEYLKFAFGKALDHRGLSAGRSVEKMTEFAWLQGRDDVVAAMDRAPYENYGVPKLLVYADAFGRPVPDDDGLRRMGKGLPCEPDCDEGCGA